MSVTARSLPSPPAAAAAPLPRLSLALSYGRLAQLLDQHLLEHRYLSMLEELLEMNAAVALLLCAFVLGPQPRSSGSAGL